LELKFRKGEDKTNMPKSKVNWHKKSLEIIVPRLAKCADY